jgi:DNA-binding beta-propeller fold protein YncE
MLGANREIPWDLRTASFKKDFFVGSQFGLPRAVAFKNDGTRMYVTGEQGPSGAQSWVGQYDLSSAWDISTASFDEGYTVAPDAAYPVGVLFSSDGTKMFVLHNPPFGSTKIYEYSLSTAWDVTSSSVVRNVAFTAEAFFFHSDGLSLYAVNDTSFTTVSQYSMSSAYDITTLSLVNSQSSFGLLAVDGLALDDDRKSMYLARSGSVHQYSLSTSGDVTTSLAQYTFLANEPGQTVNAVNGIAWKPDGTKMFGAFFDSTFPPAQREIREFSIS